MRRLAGVIRGGYELGALSAGEEASCLYRSLGWQRWGGRTFVLAPSAIQRTADEDQATFVLPLDAELDLGGDLICDWRDGDVW
jgi:aminoglycoside 2'-N-acetyltransferase I